MFRAQLAGQGRAVAATTRSDRIKLPYPSCTPPPRRPARPILTADQTLIQHVGQIDHTKIPNCRSKRPVLAMWSSIGRATARQVRVGSGLSIRTTRRIAAQLTPRAAPVIPSGIRIAAVFARGFAEAARPKKTATSTAAKTKKPSAKKTGAKKTATKKAKPKRPAAKKAKAKKVLTEEQKINRRIAELKKTALLKDEPTLLPNTTWMVFVAEQLREGKEQIQTAMAKLSIQYKALSASEIEVSLMGDGENLVVPPGTATRH